MISVHEMEDKYVSYGTTIGVTMFPDKTSQVWKLPENILAMNECRIVWRFDEEAEIMHLASLRRLLWPRVMHLFVPYLPYARQDKVVKNDSTFNLHVFAEIINSMKFASVTTVDVHNQDSGHLINNLFNVDIEPIQRKVIDLVRPDYIVYPDVGALQRYRLDGNRIVFYKARDPLTGEITGHEISIKDSRLPHTLHASEPWIIEDWQKFLIVDDLCDGGATFISIAKKLRAVKKQIDIALFVTHGVFSRGLEPLEKEGIRIFTTNTVRKNTGGFEVFP